MCFHRKETRGLKRKSVTNAARLRSPSVPRHRDCLTRSTLAACRPAQCGDIEGKCILPKLTHPFVVLQFNQRVALLVNHRHRSTSISNVAYSGAPLSRRSSERELSDVPKKRATSAGGLDRNEGLLYYTSCVHVLIGNRITLRTRHILFALNSDKNGVNLFTKHLS